MRVLVNCFNKGQRVSSQAYKSLQTAHNAAMTAAKQGLTVKTEYLVRNARQSKMSDCRPLVTNWKWLQNAEIIKRKS